MAEPFMGEIRLMSFVFAPKDWALCNGQLMAISQNQALFSLLGTTYGGDGRTTFGLPDYRGRTPTHAGGQGHFQGERGGEEAHMLSISELPSHSHVLAANSAAGNATVPGNAILSKAPANVYGPFSQPVAMKPGSIANNGGGQAHQNMQPFLTLSFCIALQGIFPSRN